MSNRNLQIKFEIQKELVEINDIVIEIMSVMTDLKKLTAPRGILNLTLGKAQESFEPILKHLKISQEDSENPTLLEQTHSYLDHSSWRSDSIA